MNPQNEALFPGVGRRERRRMIKRWKEENNGLSLKAWARLQHPVGDSAYMWWRGKSSRPPDNSRGGDNER